MHQGLALDRLGDLIIKQNAEKRDIVAPASKLTLVASADVPALTFDLKDQQFTAEHTPFALRQIGQWAEIPAKYLDRLAKPENRELLAANANWWLKHSGEKRMVRMFVNGNVIAIAFLSDRYRP
jgi:hypothetical protein